MLEPDTTIQYSDPPVYGKCSPSNPLGRLELLLRLVLKVTKRTNLIITFVTKITPN